MDKNISVKDLISITNQKPFIAENVKKELNRVIKYSNYDSQLLSSLANLVVTNAHIKDKENKLWIDTNKQKYLLDITFLTELTNIDINQNIAINEYNSLVQSGIMNCIYESTLYCSFNEYVNNAKNDLVSNNKITFYNNYELFINILMKTIDTLINVTNKTLDDLDINEFANKINTENVDEV